MAVPGRAGWRTKTVRVDGLTEAKSALSRLPEAFREVMAESIATGAAIIESEAHRRVPYDEGDLDRSIGTNIRDDGLQAAVGTGLHYGPKVELGTFRTRAQPWLYPAFRTGARFVRKQIRGWATEAGAKARFKTRRRSR